MQNSSPARLLDGTTPFPMQGTLYLSPSEIQFQPRNGSPRIRNIADIKQTTQLHDGLHIEFIPEAPGKPEWKIICETSGMEAELDRLRAEHGGLQTGKIWLKRIPILTWILLALVVVPG